MSGAPEPRPARTALVVAFATIYLVWGSTYLGMRVAVETMPPFMMAAGRFLLAGGALYAFLRLRGLMGATARQWRDNAIVGALLLLGGNGLVAWSEQFIPSGVTALFLAVSPAFFVLIEWAWPGGQRPTPLVLLGLVLGFVGVMWLAAPWETRTEAALDVTALGALLAASFLFPLGSIWSRHAKEPAPAFVAAALQMVCGGASLALVSAAGGEWARVDLAAISARSWWAFAYLVVAGSLVGFSTFVWLMKNSTPARVSTYAFVNPVVAVFLGWLLLDEAVSARTLGAAVLIIGAVVLITFQKTRSRAAK
jgi:drug/metabolite transporter (DMT)-like permease